MFCKNHTERSGINTCSKCGDWLCSECSVDIDGRIMCKACLSRAMNGSGYKKAEPTSRRRVSWLLLFMFSFIPGANYMFMGLIKRGLFALTSMFMSIYLICLFEGPLFAFVLAILCITCFFDGFQIRRRINSGEDVPDDVDDLLGFFRKHKSAVICSSLILVALGSLERFGNIMWRYTGYHSPLGEIFSSILPLLILGFGLYALIKSRKLGKDKPEKDYIDTHKGESN